MSALKRAFPLLIAAFVIWTLWRHRLRSRATRATISAAEPATAAGGLPAAEQPTDPPAYTGLTPVRWEPPVKSDPAVLHRRVANPTAVDQADSAAPKRGRIEDLLERARNEDEGAA